MSYAMRLGSNQPRQAEHKAGVCKLAPAYRVAKLAFVKGLEQPGNFDDVIQEVNVLCGAIGRGCVVKNRSKIRLNVVCSMRDHEGGCHPSQTAESCPFFIGCKQIAGKVRFTTLRLHHKCRGNTGRVRGIKTQVLRGLSIHIDAFTASKSRKGGNAFQLQDDSDTWNPMS